MNKLLIFGTITILGAIALSGCNSSSQNTSNTASNRNSSNGNQMMNMNNSNTIRTGVVENSFWTNAGQGGMAEVEMGKLASTKAQNLEVKKFAAMMVTDHTKANDELKALATKNSAVIPTDIDSSHKSARDKLNGLSGADFDKAYVDGQIADHQATVKLFEDQAKDDSNAELKAFAVKTLPTIKSHLDMINGIKAKMK